MMVISGWGRYPIIEAKVTLPTSYVLLKRQLADNEALVSRGLGRSYGDSSLSDNIVSMLRLNRLLGFDEEEGILACEAGVSLSDVLNVFVPRGWFLNVVPGTRFVTVGGAIASDIHGKNHHREGSFTDHVVSMDVMLPSGEIVTCSRDKESDLFMATCGGMGLTGVILSASFRLKRIETAYINQLTIKATGLDDIMDLFEQYENYTYTVAWIDCMTGGSAIGRSVLMLGEHATNEDLSPKQDTLRLKGKKAVRIPVDFPGFVLNRLSMKAFNSLYYKKHADAQDSLVDYETFFFPLDGIRDWNRIYGKRGFTQYQFVVPKDAGREACVEVLKKVSQSREGVFLAVLKLFGNGNDNLLSFPMEGYTLAMDFPITRSLFSFLDELDEMVLEYGGRLYLTKDARMSGEMFRKSYKNAESFIQFKHRLDETNRFQSLQSRRLGII
jgi:FAD/FMN-containing dehydrogenase